MRFPVVLFDLDGTLIDSGEIILASFRHAARTVLGDVPDERILTAVGAPNLLEQMRALEATRVDELVATYREHNLPLHAGLRPCAGMDGVLERLRAEGRRLGVVTAKRRVTVRLAFDVVPIEPYFDVVVTADDTDRHKPHPQPVLRALELLGAAPEDAAYVGDAPSDVEAAKAAGVFAVGVTWGGLHTEERLREAEPSALVHNAEELLGVL